MDRLVVFPSSIYCLLFFLLETHPILPVSYHRVVAKATNARWVCRAAAVDHFVMRNKFKVSSLAYTRWFIVALCEFLYWHHGRRVSRRLLVCVLIIIFWLVGCGELWLDTRDQESPVLFQERRRANVISSKNSCGDQILKNMTLLCSKFSRIGLVFVSTMSSVDSLLLVRSCPSIIIISIQIVVPFLQIVLLPSVSIAYLAPLFGTVPYVEVV